MTPFSHHDLASVIGPHRLQILEQAASPSFPISRIRSAANAALTTLNLAMSISGRHRANLISIGREACVITVNVVQRVNLDGSGYMVHSQYTSSLDQDSATLAREMEAIASDVASRRNSGGFRRFSCLRAADARVVEICRTRLNRALQLFELQSNIDLRQQVTLLDNNLQAVLAKQNQMQMPLPAPFSSNSLHMHVPLPELAPQSYPPVSPVSVWPQPSIPSCGFKPSFPQPVLTSSPSFPNHETAYISKEDKRAARHARREARASQQAQRAAIGIGITSSPDLPIPCNTFTHVQNHLFPGGNFTHHYVNGNAINSSRDDSFRISGSGNNINISFTANRP